MQETDRHLPEMCVEMSWNSKKEKGSAVKVSVEETWRVEDEK